MTSSYDDSIWELVADGARPLSPRLAHRATEFLGKAERVLDLGCGDGQYLPTLAQPGARVLGADRSAVALERAARRAPMADLSLIGDDQRLTLEDNSVDRIWCVDTIEHVVDTQVFLSEARRVLTPGGRILVATPNHPFRLRARLALKGWSEFFDPFSPHLRFYTAKSLRSALDGCGFDVVEIDARGEMLVAEAVRV